MNVKRATAGFDSRVAGVMLVLVVAWALAAVVLLTGIEVNLHQVNDRVIVIDHRLPPIRSNTSFIRLAAATAQVTTAINHAAAPLTGELQKTLVSARQIDSKVPPILSKVQAINTEARSINTTVGSIDTTAHQINANVASIGTSVASISASVSSVAADVASIHSRVSTVLSAVGPRGSTNGSINGSVASIEGRLGGVLATAHTIDKGVNLINVNALRVIDIARPLTQLFNGILAAVGTTVGSGTVLGHANSIDCATLIKGPSCKAAVGTASRG